MPLPLPDLDDRRVDDLVADLLARIPGHTPEWTNPRVGDPGRTLIELFAFLADSILYRANQVPELQRRVFLNLLGMGLKPARAARGLVALKFQDDLRDAFDLRARGRIDRPVAFETVQEVSVAPVTGEIYLKRRVVAEGNADLTETLAQLGSLYGGRSLDAYETTPLFTNGFADAAGIDLMADSIDGALWIALLAPKPARDEDPATLRARVAQLMARNDAGGVRLLNVGIVPALTLPDDETLATDRSRIGSQWEISVNAGRATDYQTLDAIEDSTDGLRRAGVLRLALPGADLIGVGSSARTLSTESGVDDEPPRMDDPERQQRLVAWLRMRPAAGTTQLRLSWAGVHVVQIEQLVTASSLVVAQTSGAPGDIVALPLRNIDPASLAIDIAEPAADYVPWTRVDDLALVSHNANQARDARAFELDAEGGQLRFGDGVRGRVPPSGSRVRISSARAGGGRAGNLAPGTLKDIVLQDLASGAPVTKFKLQQPVPTMGGEDAESVELAQARIPAALRHHDRAVTAIDYQTLAGETPGTDVARVEVLPRFAPRSRAFGVPGVVTVMVLPGTITGEVGVAPNPRADTPFIEAVFAQLDARRPLATELYVIGCEYLPISVSIAVGLRDDAPRDATLLAVRQAVRRLLWPLAPGGFDGNGWPLGRSLADRELEVEVARVPGVASVAGVNLFTQTNGVWSVAPRDSTGMQHVALQPWQLPELMQVVADVGNVPAATLSTGSNSGSGGTRVAVPVVVDMC
jgi:hypothetical protein